MLYLLVEQQRGQSLLGTSPSTRPQALFDIGKDIRLGSIDTDVEDLGGHVAATLERQCGLVRLLARHEQSY